MGGVLTPLTIRAWVGAKHQSLSSVTSVDGETLSGPLVEEVELDLVFLPTQWLNAEVPDGTSLLKMLARAAES